MSGKIPKTKDNIEEILEKFPDMKSRLILHNKLEREIKSSLLESQFNIDKNTLFTPQEMAKFEGICRGSVTYNIANHYQASRRNGNTHLIEAWSSRKITKVFNFIKTKVGYEN